MTGNKHILRRTAAFVTSLVFMFTGLSYGFVTAEEAAGTEISANEKNVISGNGPAEETDNEKSADSENGRTDAPANGGPDVSGSVITDNSDSDGGASGSSSSYDTENGIFSDSGIHDVQNGISGPVTEASVRFRIYGGSEPELMRLAHIMFESAELYGIYDNAVAMRIPGQCMIKDVFAYREQIAEGKQVIFRAGNRIYRLDDFMHWDNYSEVTLTEYYDISAVPGDVIKLIPSDPSAVYEGVYCPHGSSVTLSAEKGWTIEKTGQTEILGKVSQSLENEGGFYSVFFRNGSSLRKISAHKNQYTVSVKNDIIDSAVINSVNILSQENGTDSSDVKTYTGRWLDDSKISAEFVIKDDCGSRVRGVKLRNTATNQMWNMSVTGDGTSVKAEIDSDMVSSGMTDGAGYSLEFDTVPDKLKIDTYIADSPEEQFYRSVDMETLVRDGSAFVQVPPVLYENGTARYIIDCWKIKDSENKVDSKKLFDNGTLNDCISVTYDKSLSIAYKSIVQDTEIQWKASDIIGRKNENVFSVKSGLFTNLLQIIDTSKDNKLALYDTLNQNHEIISLESLIDNQFVYYYPPNLEYKIIDLRLKSILYYENNEFHNMLQEPLYFYFDTHAPEITVTNDTDDDYSGGDGWYKNTFRFILDYNDKERFVPVNGAADGVNDIYRNIDGAGSEIGSITVGDSVLKRENGRWVLQDSGKESDFDVKISDAGENRYSVSVKIKPGASLNGTERALEITAADLCGNVSKPQKAEIKIDNEKPVITSMALEGAVHYTDPRGAGTPNKGKTSASGLAGRAGHIDTAYLSVETLDLYSGISGVKVVYGNEWKRYSAETLMQDEKYRFTRTPDGRCSFRLPVNASVNCKSEIEVIISDTAGNDNAYYYNGDQEPVLYSAGAASAVQAVMDSTVPVIFLAASEKPSYTDAAGKKNWYREIPEIKVSAADTDGGINSGLRYIVFSVNGAEKRTEDLFTDSTGNFSITAVHSRENPDMADIFITEENPATGQKTSTKITTVTLADTDGEIKIGAVAYDAAGNPSEKAEITLWSDPTPPAASESFNIENANGCFKSFGTFLGSQSKLTADVREPAGKASSGLASAVLSFNGEEYVYKFTSEKSATAEFMIPSDSLLKNPVSGSAVITLKDNAGNVYRSEKLISPAGSTEIILENNPPVITETQTDSRVMYTDDEGRNWYSDTVSIALNIDDSNGGAVHSGLESAEVIVNGVKKNDDSQLKKEKVSAVSLSVTAGGKDDSTDDGRFVVIARAADNASNRAQEFRKEVYIDRTAPEITGIGIKGAGSIPASHYTGVFPLAYGHFFSEKCTLTVTAADENESAGLKNICMDLYDFNGNAAETMVVSGESLAAGEHGYSADFEIPEGFRGYIAAYAEDNVSNVSEKLTASGFIVENRERHAGHSDAHITLPETEYQDRNGISLYSGEITAEISASDSFSGIRSVEWNATEYGADKWKSVTADEKGYISGDSAEDFEVVTHDRNLAAEIKGRAALKQDRNSGIFRIRMTDMAGNTSEDTKQFSIDMKPPVITVSYENAQSDETSGIFREQRTAAVRVSERNFDPDRISVTAEGNSGGVSFGSWALVSGEEGTDGAVYRMPVTFSGNGEYILRAEGTDMCANEAQKYESEKFIIDRTAPVMTVESSGAELKNGYCWNGARTVTVRITEHNFDPSRIRITGTLNGSAEAFPEAGAFRSDGDVHTAVIVFAEDGDYTLRIEGEDAAGNEMESFSDSFTVDGSAPDIRFEGVSDKSANSGEINLSVFVREANADAGRISVAVNGARRGDVSEMAGTPERTDGGYRISFSEFVKEKAYDDIYTVNVTASDRAEHSAEKSITFSVNRFGSTYVFDDSTHEVSGRYIQKPVDIILHEINADMLRENKSAVRVIGDSDTVTLEKDRDYTIELTGGDGSWYDYCYTISASNFRNDGAYMVTVSSEDAAGNKNINSAGEKMAELKFGVDQTPPRCIPINVEKNGTYRRDSMDAEFICEDNIMMNGVEVFLDGNDVTGKAVTDGAKLRVNLMSSANPQELRVDMTDIAGNKAELVVDNILVSTNLFLITVHRPVVRNSVILAVAAGIGAVVIRRRREAKKWSTGGR